MFILYANKNSLSVQKREIVTSGSVNAYSARFEFSPEWDGLTRTAVFKAGAETHSILLDETGACIIPWEVLTSHGRRLTVGVYGTRDGDVLLPTVWTSLGIILEGVISGGELSKPPPTPDLWEQELGRKGDALEYDGLNLSLVSGSKLLSTVQIKSSGDSPAYQFGHGLKVTETTITVDTVDNFEGDNTLPMTAAGVLTTVGNIEALLGTI